MNLIIFTLTIVLLIYISSLSTRSIINPFNLIAIPYLLIILGNNIYFSKYGFYLVTDSTFIILLAGLFMFFSGVIAGNYVKLVDLKHIESSKKSYNIKLIISYSVIVEVVIMIRIITAIYSHGLSWLTSDVNEGYLMSGVIGHLMLTLYITLPIVFYTWLKNKNKYFYLMVVLVGMFSMFMTFVKYHSICLVLVIFLYCCANDSHYIKKGLILMVILSTLLFVGNYLITFWSRNAVDEVNSSFYVNHFWKYVAGSIINDNKLISNRINYEYDVSYKVITLFFPLINMVLALFGYDKLFSKPSLPMMLVAINGERSNVIDQIGYLFPSNLELTEIILFLTFFFLFGLTSELIFKYCFLGPQKFKLFGSIYLTFFCFLSFFGVYGSLSNPWELLVMSMILPIVFMGKIKLKDGGTQKYE